MSNFEPLVSIIIPVYNGADFMAEAIDSALAQTYRNLEVLVINDGSRDDGKTEEIAISYGSRIRYFSKPNGGVASALNFGIREMRGEYFSWLSHDDLYYPSKVEEQVKLAASNRDSVIYSRFESVDAGGAFLAADDSPEILPEEFLLKLVALGHINGCTLLIPRKCFELCGTFDEALRTTQDYALWFQFAQKFRFVQLNRVLVKSRVHGNQGSVAIPTHWRAVNDLHKWFLDEIAAKRLVAADDAELAQLYLQIGEVLNRRFLYWAAGRAADLALARARCNTRALALTLPSIIGLKCNAKKMHLIHFLTFYKKKYFG